MLKQLSELLGFKGASGNNELIERIRAEFIEDYIDNTSFIESFSLDIRPSIKVTIETISKDSSSKEINSIASDPIYHIFGGLKILYISLWLEETDYGEKLALKMNQLVYTDDYGDICFDDWKRELKKFISDRLYKLDSYLRQSIPGKYQTYAKRLDMDYHLNIQMKNVDYPVQDVVEDLCLEISLNIDSYNERLSDSSTLINSEKKPGHP